MSASSDDVGPSTWRQSLPHEEEIRKGGKVAKQFFEEEQDPSQVSTTASPIPKMERLSSLEPEAPKHCTKSSKKKKLHQKVMMSRVLR